MLFIPVTLLPYCVDGRALSSCGDLCGSMRGVRARCAPVLLAASRNLGAPVASLCVQFLNATT